MHSAELEEGTAAFLPNPPAGGSAGTGSNPREVNSARSRRERPGRSPFAEFHGEMGVQRHGRREGVPGGAVEAIDGHLPGVGLRPDATQGAGHGRLRLGHEARRGPCVFAAQLRALLTVPESGRDDGGAAFPQAPSPGGRKAQAQTVVLSRRSSVLCHNRPLASEAALISRAGRIPAPDVALDQTIKGVADHGHSARGVTRVDQDKM